jgi:cyclopropane fatty-acyl-phospholipid synthase-like methyltransferase
MRWASRHTHRWQAEAEWGHPPPPEWFDHYVGLHYMGDAQRHNITEERGVFASLAVPIGGVVLDLCCGDGFFARHFYANRAEVVVAVDFDEDAIQYAKRVNAAPNVTYELRDVRESLPDGQFDTVVWSGAIEHFTADEVIGILEGVRTRLEGRGGVLAGDTIAAGDSDRPQLVHHEFEYRDEDHLRRTLERVFPAVAVWRSEWPSRTELYFYGARESTAIPLGLTSPNYVREKISG